MRDYTHILRYFEEPAPCAEVRDAIARVSDYDSYSLRSVAIKQYGFSIPTIEAVNLVASFTPLVEVGAGSGYWSCLLKKVGADIITTDIGQQKEFSKFWNGTDVLQMSADDAVVKWPKRNVFVSWPSYDSSWAYEMAKKMKPGRVLAYIGEYNGGCTADEHFFKLLNEGFEDIGGLGLPTWPGIHDSLGIYRRK